MNLQVPSTPTGAGSDLRLCQVLDLRGWTPSPAVSVWVVVKIMVPFWVPNILIPRRDPNFDNRPYRTLKDPCGHGCCRFCNGACPNPKALRTHVVRLLGPNILYTAFETF